MTITLSAAALRMPHMASVAAPAPLALGVSAEPCASKAAMLPSHRAHGLGFGGIIAPAFAGRRGGTDGSDRFGGITRSSIGGGWDRQDQAQLAGGGPLRG
ncbi:MAG TPA: hypothetical protein VGO40_19150 [Longimicrobium sp.]|jgi:hypothetical protein|nr:hypothetical protein [Longimicrobium sp.]